VCNKQYLFHENYLYKSIDCEIRAQNNFVDKPTKSLFGACKTPSFLRSATWTADLGLPPWRARIPAVRVHAATDVGGAAGQSRERLVA
jgi:hypothetical protein